MSNNNPKRTVNKLSERKDLAIPKAINARDVLDRDFILEKFELQEGDFGQYALLTCTDVLSNGEAVITSGSKPVLRQLSKFDPETDLPIEFRFESVGKTYMMV